MPAGCRSPRTAPGRCHPGRARRDRRPVPRRSRRTRPPPGRSRPPSPSSTGSTTPSSPGSAAAGPREAAVVAVARRGPGARRRHLHRRGPAARRGRDGGGGWGRRSTTSAPSSSSRRRRSRPGGLDLVLALAHAGAAAALLACTGDAAADAPIHELATRLAAALGDAPQHDAVTIPAGDRLLSCADADDEVRVVVRERAAPTRGRRAAAPHGGHVPQRGPVRAAAARAPHQRRRPGVRAAAGHAARDGRGPGAARVAAAVRRRVPPRRRRRAARYRADPRAAGRRAGARPVVGPDLVSRQRRRRPRPVARAPRSLSGGPRGRARTARHRGRHALRRRRRPSGRGGAAARRVRGRPRDGRAAITGQPASWTALATWAVGLLDRYLAPRAADDTPWPEGELDAFDRVRERVGALAQLDDLGAPVSTVAFLRAVDDELEVSVGYGGTFGDGVLVAPLSALRGTAFDTRVRARARRGCVPASGARRPAAVRPRPQHRERAHPAQRRRGERARRLPRRARGAAPRASSPRRAPTGAAQRPARPAPWLLESASHLAGRPVLAAELDPGHLTAQDAPWLRARGVVRVRVASTHRPPDRSRSTTSAASWPGRRLAARSAGTRSRWPGPTCGWASPRSAPVAGATSAHGTA